ncbi:MAG: histidine kinase, partial [Ignavibacteria bacterium]|nr:histidine kinase [Ignavibacteria bacterium]
LHQYRQLQQQGLITDFTKETFDPASSFARVGGGSLGGKARGLGFLNILINTYNVRDRFEGAQIYVPPALVLGTDVFDQFLEENALRAFAMSSSDDEAITKTFLEAEIFPAEVLSALMALLDIIREPLAVRSSSLLEDSQYQPFAGVYETYMLPNNNPDSVVRLGELIDAVKRVYASTFYQRAKEYIKVTSYRLEEEKMAVIIQKMVGSEYGNRFYPNFAGVAKSYNFYPSAPQSSSDGIASVALGLGKMVVDGGPSVRFCPRYPGHLQQLSSIEDTLGNNQHEFFALDLTANTGVEIHTHDTLTKAFALDVAEQDGTLSFVGSTYSPENDAVYDGISRAGMRLVTFAPILKNKILQLPEILELLLSLGSGGMGTPIEIEFAVNMRVPTGKPKEFGVLQMRPLVISREFEELSIEKTDPDHIICESAQVLGNGVIDTIYDIIVVDVNTFERSKSQEVATEVGQFNSKLAAENKPYLLIGVGRWGTIDPWLGIPVRWDQISGAKTIVESGFKGFSVVPSQGSHFFQNLTAFMVGYFTVDTMHQQGFIDWEWLLRQEPVEQKMFTRHLQFSSPLIIKMNGHGNKGIILKPPVAHRGG